MIERFDLFTRYITRIYRDLQRIKNLEMVEYNLKGIHVMCLFHLNHTRKGLTVTGLGQACTEDKAAISRTVSDLVEKGLVTVDSSKKYRAPIILTEKGLAIANQIDGMVCSAVLAGGAGLNDSERRTFYKALVTISDNLAAYLKGEPNESN